MFKSVVAGCVASALMVSAASAGGFSISSTDIKAGAKITDDQVFNSFGCSGKNVSPALDWAGAPKNAKSFALMVYDPDAPTGSGFWHWVVFNISPDTKALAKGAGDPKSDAAPKRAVQSRTDFGVPGYGGPCPPKGDKPHHYHFILFAVDVDKLDADENATAAVIGFNLHFHTIAKTEFIGLYGR